MSNDTSAFPRISVIVATYNCVDTLTQCLDSICSQTYSPVELIVIDGGSTDGSTELLKERSAQIAYLVSEPDHGIYDAWNKGLARASGEWICFLGADDYFWNADVLHLAVQQLIALPAETLVAYGKIMVVDKAGNKLYTSGQPWAAVGSRFRALMSIPHPGTMHRAELFKRYGRFDPSFRIAGDYDLLLRELKNGQAHFLDDIVTAGVRQGGVSTDSKNILLAMHELRKAQKKQNIKMPPLLWMITISKVYLRIAFFNILGKSISERLINLVRKCPGVSFNWTETKSQPDESK